MHKDMFNRENCLFQLMSANPLSPVNLHTDLETTLLYIIV